MLTVGEDRESQRAAERVYELVTEEIGDKTPNEELQRLIKNYASNDTDIPYEEFHSIMTKEVSLK